jgi:hypothetical protein
MTFICGDFHLLKLELNKCPQRESEDEKEETFTLDISGGFLGNSPPYFFLIISSCRRQNSRQ